MINSKHSWNVCLQAIPQYVAYSWKSEKNRPWLIIIPSKIYLEVFPFKNFSTCVSFFPLALSLSPYWGFEKTTLMWLNWKIMNQTMPAIIHVSWSKLLCTCGAVSIRILQKIYSLRRDVVFSSMTNFRDIRNSGILINGDYQLFVPFSCSWSK